MTERIRLIVWIYLAACGGGAARSVSCGAAAATTTSLSSSSTTSRTLPNVLGTRSSSSSSSRRVLAQLRAGIDGSLAVQTKRRRRRANSERMGSTATIPSSYDDVGSASASDSASIQLLDDSGPPSAFGPFVVPVSSFSTAAVPAFGVRRNGLAFGLSSRQTSLLDQLRGGATADDNDDSDEDDDDDDDDDDRDSDSEARSSETISTRESAEETKVEDDDDEEEDASSSSGSGHPMSTVMSMEPVMVVVKTSTGNNVVDQTVEFTVHPSRDVASIKQSLRRLLPGKPPVSMLRLVQSNVVLQDELMVNELLEDDDDDDDDVEPDDEGDGDDEGGRKKKKLRLQLDMVPPVDPKFVVQLAVQMPEMTVSDLLDAYAMNEAASHVHASTLMATQPAAQQDNDEIEEDRDDDEESLPESASSRPPILTSQSVTQQIKEQAAKIRKDLEESLLQSDAMQKVIQESKAPAFHLPNLQERQVRGYRVRQAAQGGVKTTLKRKIQRNLNVNWVDTIRHFCLFLFFGYFGGRTPFSRAVLLLGAPSVFLLQARFVKLWIRQVLYLLVDHPPSILLSLLPAPQQSILSLDVQAAMETIYGDYAVELRRRGTRATSEEEDGDDDEEEGDSEDDEVAVEDDGSSEEASDDDE